MSEVRASKEQVIVEWFEKFYACYQNYVSPSMVPKEAKDMKSAILAALEEKRVLLEILPSLVDDEPCRFDHHGDCQEHNLSLGSPGECPMPMLRQILNGKAALAEPEPVGEEERKELLAHFNATVRMADRKSPIIKALKSVGGKVSTRHDDKIRSILGNQGGAVRDKWERDRLWCSALVHVLSVEDVAKVTGYFNSIRPDREAGVAGKEKP